MTWVKAELKGEAALAARDAMQGYPKEYGPPNRDPSRVPPAVARDSIVAAHALIPDALRHMLSGLRAMFADGLPLARRQQEMIAVTVSVVNDCFY